MAIYTEPTSSISIRFPSPNSMNTRRTFLKGVGSLSTLTLLGACTEKPNTMISAPDSKQRKKVNALLISATTNPGQKSLEHAHEMIVDTFGTAKRMLLINFASLPSKRDSYAKRMRAEFSKIGPGYEMYSLHEFAFSECADAVNAADGFYVSGGNTFLLLKELYDRNLVGLIQKRALAGTPYIGSSAGSNIGGQVIGTTNDFPLVDIPTRRSLGLLGAVYNPHHPDPASDKTQFDARQWKIGEYVAHNRDQAVMGVTNPGMLRIRGDKVYLAGVDATVFIHKNDDRSVVQSTLEDLSPSL